MANKPVTPIRIPVRAPSCDGLYMPAEWEEHEATWMIWPCKPSAWPFGMGKPRKVYAEVAKAISRFEKVYMMVHPELIEDAKSHCGDAVTIVPMDTRDSWSRDSAPTFLVDGKGGVAGVDWIFNDWGHIERFEGGYDEAMALNVLEHLQMCRYAAPFIIEGGGIHTDGEGTVMTTEQVQLDLRRNAGFSKSDFEDLFAAYLGTPKTIWLGNGLEDDETNGHVDILSCFARPGTVLVHDCTDPDNGNYAVTQDAIKRLEATTDAKGRSLEIIRMPEPAPKYIDDWRMDLSYINFYICNGAIIMSSFDDPMDEVAYKRMSDVFPDREIIQIPSLDLFAGGGGIHCITQQQPKGTPLPVF
ncbi:agmatine deiminase family protein [Maridesulfovibrio sp.]|uniref:agmatine deiminase family protein n=1 Tax=Maridesulfovibrio sp. TaxID=2795000 RepID=UPI0029CA09E4|nr:agmatine deiminase family protein [Maridesulfovibrio sp.]